LRAVELRSFGGPEGLVVAARPDPQPGPGEVRVDLVAAALNRRELLGVPRQGTYAERVVVDAEQIRPRPSGWSWAETAALPVAGLTAWRALVRYRTRVLSAWPGANLLAHCAHASWRPAIDSSFPLEDVVEAHRALDAPDRFGKIVLAIDEARFYAS
jgi:NADPH:quinone reductase-like Zn-dependent oxidoreductase